MNTDPLQVEEYKSLRAEISTLVAESRNLEILALGGVAATYAWFVTSKVTAGAAWYLPVLLPLLGGLRAYALFKRIQEIGDYLRKLERSLSWTGWETHFAARVRAGISFTSLVFWMVLLVITLIAPYALPRPAL